MSSHGSWTPVSGFMEEDTPYTYPPAAYTTDASISQGSDWQQNPRTVPVAPTTSAPWLPVSDTIMFEPTAGYPSQLFPNARPIQQSSMSGRSYREYTTSSAGTPPHTPEQPGRWYCSMPECEANPEDRVFTRRSDWKRHTDKHTRPYRCPYAECAHLPGFGWIGGLNRHLEELHNAAARHKCPYPDCKRHLKGFNRSANLKNHIKKVHNAGLEATSPSATGSETDPDVVSGPRPTSSLREEICRWEMELEARERAEKDAVMKRQAAAEKLAGLRHQLAETERWDRSLRR